MTLPYETASSGKHALGEIERILSKFGAQQFGHMTDYEKGELIIQFRYCDMPIIVRASGKGYAVRWLKEHPWSHRMQKSRIEHERRALEIGNIAVYSMLRDWIKGQIGAVETGILSFEGAFLGQIMLPDGGTVLDAITNKGLLRLPKPVAA